MERGVARGSQGEPGRARMSQEEPGDPIGAPRVSWVPIGPLFRSWFLLASGSSWLLGGPRSQEIPIGPAWILSSLEDPGAHGEPGVSKRSQGEPEGARRPYRGS